MLRKGAPTLFSSIEGKLPNFIGGNVSPLKLQKSTVKLHFGFIVGNVSLYFTLQLIIKAVNYLKNRRY